VKPGDSVTVMTSTVFGGINAIDLQISGIVGTGNPESDLFVLQTTLAAAQDLLQTEKISRLVVLLRDTAETQAVRAELVRKLGGVAEVRTWQQLMPLFDQVLSMYRNQFIVFGFIIAIIIFLGVSTMTSTNIFERGREIGTMRAIGIGARTVRFIFTVEGLLQGAAGAAAGCLVALVGSWLVSVMEVTLPPPPGRNVGVPLRLLWLPEYTSMIMIVLPVIAMCAAFIISRRIARMAVVQALSDQH
jgi:putative ABC transport system permease protein